MHEFNYILLYKDRYKYFITFYFPFRLEISSLSIAALS